MEIEIANEKTCSGCRYYLQHYIKQKTRFSTVNCGHCIKERIKERKPTEYCNRWEDNDVKIKQQEKLIQNVLKNMAVKINQIATVLTNNQDV